MTELALDFPHQSKLRKNYPADNIGSFRENPESKFNQFNENVRKLREYLNKLTKSNYQKIKNSIFTKFSFNA